ncbi:cis-zeatin O-glucosyltransferase 2-like [Ananas comosus]|uniref:Cis-zeatin O-glucosyltransferase 2-like n=1 Tax=Ananas comosus TaxID=4615 RepID=A0A6P5FJR4_ANACO|nr:cis-zeatin O-glucosyltransferase 2-like [Ananas comosus]
MSFAAAAAAANASLPNLSSFALHTVSAFALLHFLRESRGASPIPSYDDDDDDNNNIRRDDCFSPDFLAFLRSQHGMIPPNSCRLLNSCRAIEGEFIDQLAKEPAWRAKKTYAIGPLNPTAITRADGGRRHDCLKWLDTQRPGSVLYVSFGTASPLPKGQTAELAAGLEAAGVPFVWAVRRADRANIYENNDDDDDDDDDDVSREFERRVEWGRVVRGWAPQGEVLRHGSTGGFMSHCGWNSCMESMGAGVPMLTWPMHSDQPRNAQLVARVLGAGVAAREWAARGGVVAAAAIRDAVVAFMLGDEGAAARSRARLVGDQLRRAAAEGGSSRTDFDAFVADITN